jgi:hypothetical protein
VEGKYDKINKKIISIFVNFTNVFMVKRIYKINKMYIGVNRVGGLGNQLFQYAAARAVLFYNPESKILVDNESINIHNHMNRNYAKIFMKDAIEVNHITDMLDGDKHYTIFEQGKFSTPWDPSLITTLPVYLQGYFQYLPAIHCVLPKITMEMLSELSIHQVEIIKKYHLQPHKSVFIHVRRGDYLNISHFHFVQEMKYYEEAYNNLFQNFENPTNYISIYLLSDDNDLCKQQSWSFKATIVDEKDELKTLALMSLCKAGAIIGNSSFSYWGAILCDARYIYYPEKWINDTIYDLFPKHWIKI